MKFGAHIFLWTERWCNGELPLVPRAAGLGLQTLEIAVGDDVEFAPIRVRAACADAGLHLVLSPGGDWPVRADISHPDPEARVCGRRWHENWLERGGDAGAVAYTGALYAHPGRVERRAPSGDEFRHAAEGLHALAECARRQGLVLVIEPMSHFRTSLVNTPAQAMALVAAADHPNLQVLFDTYHAVTEVRDYAAAIRTLVPRLWGLHACENDRGVPGSGLVPWAVIGNALRTAAFDGDVIFEAYNSALRHGEFAFSRGMFHNVCPDGDAFVRQGLAYLRDRLDAGA